MPWGFGPPRSSLGASARGHVGPTAANVPANRIVDAWSTKSSKTRDVEAAPPARLSTYSSPLLPATLRRSRHADARELSATNNSTRRRSRCALIRAHSASSGCTLNHDAAAAPTPRVLSIGQSHDDRCVVPQESKSPRQRGADEACDDESVLPLYCLDPAWATPKVVGPNRCRFLLESLEDLDETLRSRYGSRLHVVVGDPSETITKLIRDGTITKVVFEEEVAEPRELELEKRVVEAPQMKRPPSPSTHLLYDADAALAKGAPPTKMPGMVTLAGKLGAPSKPLMAPSTLPPRPAIDDTATAVPRIVGLRTNNNESGLRCYRRRIHGPRAPAGADEDATTGTTSASLGARENREAKQRPRPSRASPDDAAVAVRGLRVRVRADLPRERSRLYMRKGRTRSRPRLCWASCTSGRCPRVPCSGRSNQCVGFFIEQPSVVCKDIDWDTDFHNDWMKVQRTAVSGL